MKGSALMSILLLLIVVLLFYLLLAAYSPRVSFSECCVVKCEEKGLEFFSCRASTCKCKNSEGGVIDFELLEEECIKSLGSERNGQT